MFFEVHAATFKGVAVNTPTGDRGLVQAIDAGAVTFHYATGDKSITMAAKETISVSGACTGITSTALQNVLIS